MNLDKDKDESGLEFKIDINLNFNPIAILVFFGFLIWLANMVEK